MEELKARGPDESLRFSLINFCWHIVNLTRLFFGFGLVCLPLKRPAGLSSLNDEQIPKYLDPVAQHADATALAQVPNYQYCGDGNLSILRYQVKETNNVARPAKTLQV